VADAELLTVRRALSIILGTISVMPPEQISLLESLERVVASDVQANDNLPPFSNSAMDGYAIKTADVSLAQEDVPVRLRVIEDIAAGHIPEQLITPGHAARITTGAPIPEGADTVVPVENTSEPWREKTRSLPDTIDVYHPEKFGSHIRLVGEDIKKGSCVIEAGTVIRAQEIAVLASLGYAQVKVFKKPKVGLLATGDELIEIGEPLLPGKIRNSNSLTQAAQVIAAGGIPVIMGVAKDDASDVSNCLQKGLAAGVDLFVSTAGVSVGAYDVVRTVLEQEGDFRFWRVRMRPGKPLAFGKYAKIPYVGLPGNPVSAMVSFERFVRPAILKMAGHIDLDRPVITVTCLDNLKSDGRESYLRAIVEQAASGYVARLAGSQGSHIISSMMKANSLLIVPEGVEFVQAGEKLTAMILDWSRV